MELQRELWNFQITTKNDVKKLKKITEDWSGLLGLDLASKVSCKQNL